MATETRVAAGGCLLPDGFVTERMDVDACKKRAVLQRELLREALDEDKAEWCSATTDIEVVAKGAVGANRCCTSMQVGCKKATSIQRARVRNRAQEELQERAAPTPEPPTSGTCTSDEIVLRVMVCQPKEQGKGRRRMQTFLVLGSQTLRQLCEKIACPTEQLASVGGVETHGSSFLYMERTFYTHVNHDDALDYSEAIRRHASKWNANFQVKDMADTRFEDLALRVGKGVRYVYMHHGACEHLLHIEDMRLMHPSDTQNPMEYPLLVQNTKRKWKRCEVCEQRAAEWIVHRDALAPTNPCVLCDECYRLLHYTKDGVLIQGGFEVYPYVRV
mmetsp:Transcript_4672/g.29485  ORF Transcript_4672/g.29485 Transcript_4672/m.29485 type:complete len:332 (+) Transcript_4672:2781-3776(+)